MQDEQQPDLIGLSAAIVSAYVAKNHIQTVEISQLIASVHDALRNVAKPAPEPEKHKPPVPINKTIRPDYIISLEDGRRYKSLKRHLSSRGLTPEEYRKKWVKLRQGSIRVSEGAWSRPKEEGSEASGQERFRRRKALPSYLCPDWSSRSRACKSSLALPSAPSSTSRRKVGGAEQTSSIRHSKAPWHSVDFGRLYIGRPRHHCDGNRSSADARESSLQTAICQPLPSGASASSPTPLVGFAEASTDAI